MPKNKALVVEGGAMRGIFAAGVLDSFITNQYYDYDFCIGVSAGATNIIGYLGQEYKRSRKIITEYATKPDFISLRRYLAGGHLCDVEWLWHESYKREKLNFSLHTPVWVVTTSVDTGAANYYKMTLNSLNHQAIIASCAMPLAYRSYPSVYGHLMTDGGIADSIPVDFAYQQGARDITVILSRTVGYRKKPFYFSKLLGSMRKSNPELYKAMINRHAVYNKALDFISSPPSDCTVRVIAPPKSFPVSRFTTSKNVLNIGYRQGFYEGMRYLDKLKDSVF
ncbi:patatin family protein [Vibrio cholerae]|nr:patatin family protein [Vibrio cholerae]EJL6770070.1 patatin family protein [Vibrio cholerae]